MTRKYSLGLYEMKGRLKKHFFSVRCKEKENWYQKKEKKQNPVVL